MYMTIYDMHWPKNTVNKFSRSWACRRRRRQARHSQRAVAAAAAAAAPARGLTRDMATRDFDVTNEHPTILLTSFDCDSPHFGKDKQGLIPQEMNQKIFSALCFLKKCLYEKHSCGILSIHHSACQKYLIMVSEINKPQMSMEHNGTSFHGSKKNPPGPGNRMLSQAFGSAAWRGSKHFSSIRSIRSTSALLAFSLHKSFHGSGARVAPAPRNAAIPVHWRSSHLAHAKPSRKDIQRSGDDKGMRVILSTPPILDANAQE